MTSLKVLAAINTYTIISLKKKSHPLFEQSHCIGCFQYMHLLTSIVELSAVDGQCCHSIHPCAFLLHACTSAPAVKASLYSSWQLLTAVFHCQFNISSCYFCVIHNLSQNNI